jgi:hypothetical protein
MINECGCIKFTFFTGMNNFPLIDKFGKGVDPLENITVARKRYEFCGFILVKVENFFPNIYRKFLNLIKIKA